MGQGASVHPGGPAAGATAVRMHARNRRVQKRVGAILQSKVMAVASSSATEQEECGKGEGMYKPSLSLESSVSTPTGSESSDTTQEETTIESLAIFTPTPLWEDAKTSRRIEKSPARGAAASRSPVPLLEGNAVTAHGEVWRKAASPKPTEEDKEMRAVRSMHARSMRELAQVASHRKRLQEINSFEPGKSFTLQLPTDMRRLSEVVPKEGKTANPFPGLRVDVGDMSTVPEANEDTLSPSPVHALPSPTRPPPLALTSQVIHDDDWISVDSDGEDFDDDVMPSRPGLPHNPIYIDSEPVMSNSREDSWMITRSGKLHLPFHATGGATIGPRGVVFGEDSAPITPHGSGLPPLLPLTDRLVVLSKLGEGASAHVFKCYDLEFQEIVAVKVIPIFNVSKRGQFMHELEALRSSLEDQELHESPQSYVEKLEPTEDGQLPAVEAGIPFLLRFKDAFCNREEATIALTMEHMDGGSLEDIVDTGGLRFEPTIASIAYQVLLGLRLLHHKGQLHRDLKPANILMSRKGHVRISDFGVARNFMPQEQEMVAQTFVGTVTYMSPERMAGEGYTFSSDVWSFGLTMLTVALGHMPMADARGYWSVLHAIRDEEPPSIPDDGSWSEEFRDFISCCLKKEASERWTCDQLLCHPFLSQRSFDHRGTTTSSRQEYDATVCDFLNILDSIYVHLRANPEKFDNFLKAKLRQVGRPVEDEDEPIAMSEMLRRLLLDLDDDPLMLQKLDMPTEDCVEIVENMVSRIAIEEAETHREDFGSWSEADLACGAGMTTAEASRSPGILPVCAAE
uniref:mitogen-activated protein kinase kinase n=1 Tax=Phaeomonas parva TaxID=124430 RepID=A0A7S1UCH8_9STRA|mmetsp:Transcript_41542/g.130081  ORF Transcript_41542/g.130081 Transcript_41542/m.130081 type:complete len:797 (+) Transcript_41542:285-2675(+)